MNADEDYVIFAHPSSGCGATVAHQLPKLRVAGSNPVARSSKRSTRSELPQNESGSGRKFKNSTEHHSCWIVRRLLKVGFPGQNLTVCSDDSLQNGCKRLYSSIRFAYSTKLKHKYR